MNAREEALIRDAMTRARLMQRDAAIPRPRPAPRPVVAGKKKPRELERALARARNARDEWREKERLARLDRNAWKARYTAAMKARTCDVEALERELAGERFMRRQAQARLDALRNPLEAVA